MKTLIIAEKPSVAKDIVAVLDKHHKELNTDKFDKKDNYFENSNYVVASAVGHLLTIKAPEEYEVKRGKWSFNHLPVIPPHFDLIPSVKTEDKLKLLQKLIKRKDVTQIINACDAGREGELIFRYIVQHCKAKQPLSRLWLQSMTAGAILDAFKNLRSDAELLPLADAARCRSEADWLVGINGTRAMTAFNSKEGGFYLTTVGRVQTPTLALVVERDKSIESFIETPYWEIFADFLTEKKQQYLGRWFDPQFKKSKNGSSAILSKLPNITAEHLRESRLWNEKDTKNIIQACLQATKIEVNEETKPSSENAPLLYDLTSLQREANSRFGFSAKNTLSIAQSLYEKHKLLTYPRTDSKALPEDYFPTIPNLMNNLEQITHYAPFVGIFTKSPKKLDVHQNNKRIFDNKKVSDHFAIIPTLTEHSKNINTIIDGLSEAEFKIYDMVVRRFIAIFYPPAQYLNTVRISQLHTKDLGIQSFKTEGKILTDAGWKIIYQNNYKNKENKENLESKDELLAPLALPVSLEKIRDDAKNTKPPARYSEATLLSAMEGADKLVDDEALKEAMNGKGLGTPATRSSIIEGLLDEQYLIRENGQLLSTPKSKSLMVLLKGLNIAELTSPELTGEWEHQLKLIEQGKMSREQFMNNIALMTRQMIEQARDAQTTDIQGDFATLKTPCPVCQKTVIETYRRFQCSHYEFSENLSKKSKETKGSKDSTDSKESKTKSKSVQEKVDKEILITTTHSTGCHFSIPKTPGSRLLSASEADELLAQKRVGPLNDFRSKLGRSFSAWLILDEDLKLTFDFGQPSEENLQEALSEAAVFCSCPQCQVGNIKQLPTSYACDNCDVRLGMTILQQPIDEQQALKWFQEGKTDLLHQFVSNKTKRAFSAFLERDENSKIKFSFAPKVSANKSDKVTEVKPKKKPKS